MLPPLSRLSRAAIVESCCQRLLLAFGLVALLLPDMSVQMRRSSNTLLSQAGQKRFDQHQHQALTDGLPSLKVLNLNTWGLGWPWSRDRPERYRALREIVTMGDYDVILLQEVWYRKDYDILLRSAPFITYFDTFSTGCTGYFLPIGCSGLIILSKHPILDVEFKPFSNRGSFWNFDGEIFVSKGVAKARIQWQGLWVDLFTTHFVSYTNHPNVDNVKIRFIQSVETRHYIESSDADIKILGGDLNTLPIQGPRQPYTVLTSIMKDALTDRHPDASLHPWFATFGNVRNTYTGRDDPERIDYILFWARPGLVMLTKDFFMPMFMTRSKDNDLINLSDHEALVAEFVIYEADDLDLYSSSSYNQITNEIIDNAVVPRDHSSSSSSYLNASEPTSQPRPSGYLDTNEVQVSVQ